MARTLEGVFGTPEQMESLGGLTNEERRRLAAKRAASNQVFFFDGRGELFCYDGIQLKAVTGQTI